MKHKRNPIYIGEAAASKLVSEGRVGKLITHSTKTGIYHPVLYLGTYKGTSGILFDHLATITRVTFPTRCLSLHGNILTTKHEGLKMSTYKPGHNMYDFYYSLLESRRQNG
jgi:hypothetical protein